MVVYGCTWMYKALHGCTRLYNVVHCCTSLYMILQGCTLCTWLYKFVHCCTRLYIIVQCRTWLYKVVQSCTWLLKMKSYRFTDLQTELSCKVANQQSFKVPKLKSNKVLQSYKVLQNVTKCDKVTKSLVIQSHSHTVTQSPSRNVAKLQSCKFHLCDRVRDRLTCQIVNMHKNLKSSCNPIVL